MTLVLLALCLILGIVSHVLWRRQRAAQREAFIRGYLLPDGLYDKMRERHPGMSAKQFQLVAQGLRQFFLAHLKSGRQYVSMPSQVVDDLWHEFILYTRHYQEFCKKGFGQFFHHTPAVVLGDQRKSNAGLRRCWWQACQQENINPVRPSRLPLLFALDSKLAIANGFVYLPNCEVVRRRAADSGGGAAVMCGGDFSSTSFAGGSEGFGEGGGSGSDSSGSDGSGDSGGGCGGGGCGGGGGGD